VAKVNANDVAYLVRQCQKEVIEEDGIDRNFVILIAIPHSSQSQKRLKLTPTLPAALRVLESKGRVSVIVDAIKGRSRTSDSRFRQFPPVQRTT